MKNSNSILAAQSKEWLLQALLILMDKKEFKNITVKEIAAKAGVDRKTFYRHFETKEDILRFYTDRACQDYIAELESQHTLTTFTISKAYFSMCQKYISFFRKLEKNNLLIFLLQAFDEYLPIIHKFFDSDDTTNNIIYYSEYALSYYTGGFWNISTKWIRDGASKTPEEMALLVEKIMSTPL